MTFQSLQRLLLTLALVAAPAVAMGQLSGPPAGGPTGQFLGPPTGNANDFLGSWALAWDGPLDSNCPCRGTLTIQVDANGDFVGYWRGKGPEAVLKGSISFNQDVWSGRFRQRDDDVDFPLQGFFRLEARDQGRTLTGSYHPEGTAIPFRWSGTRS